MSGVLAPGAPEIRPYGAGSYVVLTLPGFRDHFGQDLASDETALLHATQGPFAQGSNDEKITNAAWRDKPSWFVIGENDHMLLFELEKATAQKLGEKTSCCLPVTFPCFLSHTRSRTLSRRQRANWARAGKRRLEPRCLPPFSV